MQRENGFYSDQEQQYGRYNSKYLSLLSIWPVYIYDYF